MESHNTSSQSEQAPDNQTNLAKQSNQSIDFENRSYESLSVYERRLKQRARIQKTKKASLERKQRDRVIKQNSQSSKWSGLMRQGNNILQVNRSEYSELELAGLKDPSKNSQKQQPPPTPSTSNTPNNAPSKEKQKSLPAPDAEVISISSGSAGNSPKQKPSEFS